MYNDVTTKDQGAVILGPKARRADNKFLFILILIKNIHYIYALLILFRSFDYKLLHIFAQPVCVNIILSLQYLFVG